MHIIPVIDLLDGQVVHAKRGDRQHYMPIQSSLCRSSAPLDIIAALLELYPFDRLYIADITAIQCGAIQQAAIQEAAIQPRQNHFEQIREIKQHYPQLEIWLDAGFADVEALQTTTELGVQAVLGSESIRDIQQYEQLSAACKARHILSLDFKTDGQVNGFRGPQALYSNTAHWPDRMIVMTLDKVGSDAGPDFTQLNNIMQKALLDGQQRELYAAGGVRHPQDLTQLKHMGIAGVLIASALHSGVLSRGMLYDIHA